MESDTKDSFVDQLANKNSRKTKLSSEELVSSNKFYLLGLGLDFSIFQPTLTGIQKAILDTTQLVREHFELENFHFFKLQGQGSENKVIKIAHLISEKKSTDTKLSLYRPNTKNGDPRMWVSKLPEFANPLDQIAIIILDGEAYLFNLNELDYQLLSEDSEVLKCLSYLLNAKGSLAQELLSKLKEIAKNPIRADVSGDTAVGMAVEKALYIQANSRKQADYKGKIEIKTGRGKGSRTTLFAQVADWSLSHLKSSASILEKYGYSRGNDFKLYCTISTTRKNSQGLYFVYDDANDLLIEKDRNDQEVAVWTGSQLRARLLEKHTETFWIDAKSEFIDGCEYFRLISVTHTRAPLVNQLMLLLQSGVITMDHLIKKVSNGKVAEKGPLFKIAKPNLSYLFPAPKKYSLI